MCGDLNEMSPISLGHLNAWFLVMAGGGVGLGGVALFCLNS